MRSTIVSFPFSANSVASVRDDLTVCQKGCAVVQAGAQSSPVPPYVRSVGDECVPFLNFQFGLQFTIAQYPFVVARQWFNIGV